MNDPDIDSMMRSINRGIVKREFEEMDTRSIAKMTNKELASWQSDQVVESAQFILATHEWNRRLLTEQLRSIRFGVWATLIGTLAGSLGGVYLGYLLTSAP